MKAALVERISRPPMPHAEKAQKTGAAIKPEQTPRGHARVPEIVSEIPTITIFDKAPDRNLLLQRLRGEGDVPFAMSFTDIPTEVTEVPNPEQNYDIKRQKSRETTKENKISATVGQTSTQEITAMYMAKWDSVNDGTERGEEES